MVYNMVNKITPVEEKEPDEQNPENWKIISTRRL
jgi:hypothetical protein